MTPATPTAAPTVAETVALLWLSRCELAAAPDPAARATATARVRQLERRLAFLVTEEER